MPTTMARWNDADSCMATYTAFGNKTCCLSIFLSQECTSQGILSQEGTTQGDPWLCQCILLYTMYTRVYNVYIGYANVNSFSN